MTVSSSLRTILIGAAIFAAIIALLLRIQTFYATPPDRNTASPLPSFDTDVHIATPPLLTPSSRASVTTVSRGRRGIIKYVQSGKFIITPIDVADPGEHAIAVQYDDATEYILVTIAGNPQPGQLAVTRTPYMRDNFSVGDEIFALSKNNILASSTFTATRIEKIVMP